MSWPEFLERELKKKIGFHVDMKIRTSKDEEYTYNQLYDLHEHIFSLINRGNFTIETRCWENMGPY